MSLPQDLALLQFVLPKGLLDYFIVKQLLQQSETLYIHLEEKNIPPPEHPSGKLISKGFFEEIKVQDFPLRDKRVYLMIKRRRWFNTDTLQYIHRDWSLVAKGTRLTQEFASFLKEISRYKAS